MRIRLLTALLILGLSAGRIEAQVPGEVSGVGFGDPSTLGWSPVAGADSYNVYRGRVSRLASGGPPRCHGFDVLDLTFATAAVPQSGEAYFYLVTAESDLNGEGTPGNQSGGAPRSLLGNCGPVMRSHVVDRLGYGGDDWTRERIETLGIQGYIDEQLAPETIDDPFNIELKNRLQLIDPPESIFDLLGQQVVRGIYARRQLEQQAATFWANHFNTFWMKSADLFQTVYPQCDDPPVPQCDPNYPTIAYEHASEASYRDIENFRNLGFNGTFRQLLEASALGPAMILFLDTFANVAGTPNENYSRELLELYAMGVDGGYTQQDVEELARVLTGWTICKKKTADLDDPLAPCIEEYWGPTPGKWVALFRPAQHDCDPKVLFYDTAQELNIADTCGDSAAMVQELHDALDRIVEHPSTVEFISTKILKRFVTENPDEAMLNSVIAAWNDPGNPQGLGDLREVMRAALSLDAFLDADVVRGKIKTPMEHLISSMRAIRGETDGLLANGHPIIGFIARSQHIPHYNPVPTGYPESGGSWIDTTGTLERQNFGLELSVAAEPSFGSDVISLLNDNQVSTAPGNADEIVAFLAQIMFGGALTSDERQAAIDYLNTDDDGVPTVYDDTRIRETAGVLLGYAQFQEQ